MAGPIGGQEYELKFVEASVGHDQEFKGCTEEPGASGGDEGFGVTRGFKGLGVSSARSWDFRIYTDSVTALVEQPDKAAAAIWK